MGRCHILYIYIYIYIYIYDTGTYIHTHHSFSCVSFSLPRRTICRTELHHGSPGSGVSAVTNKAGQRLTVVNVMTNLFMAPNDPVFAALDGALVRNRLGRDDG